MRLHARDTVVHLLVAVHEVDAARRVVGELLVGRLLGAAVATRHAAERGRQHAALLVRLLRGLAGELWDLVHHDDVVVADLGNAALVTQEPEDAVVVRVADDQGVGIKVVLLLEPRLEVRDTAGLLHLGAVADGRRTVVRDEGDQQVAEVLDGDGDAQRHERVERHGLLAALVARHVRLQLALQRVDDHAAVAQAVGLPRLFRNDLVGAALGLHSVCGGLRLHAVQVLVQAVQQEVHELLGVLLLEPSELRCVGADLALEVRRAHDGVLAAPHLPQ